jgi:DNA (cytosine-5)-methyltransferase 1
LGGRLLGWRTVCAVESDTYARSALLARQRDGMLDPFPIWDDVRTFQGERWRGRIDVISGGFPCTDIAICGKGAGIDGEQSGLWGDMARIVHEIRPRYVFVENSPVLTSRGLGRVLGDLAEMGFDAEYGVLGARHAGAPHKRDRIWILAHARSRRGPDDGLRPGRPEPGRGGEAQVDGGGWRTESGLDCLAHGVAHRVDRLRALGNGQVPAVAALAWETLNARLHGEGVKG